MKIDIQERTYPQATLWAGKMDAVPRAGEEIVIGDSVREVFRVRYIPSENRAVVTVG